LLINSLYATSEENPVSINGKSLQNNLDEQHLFVINYIEKAKYCDVKNQVEEEEGIDNYSCSSPDV